MGISGMSTDKTRPVSNNLPACYCGQDSRFIGAIITFGGPGRPDDLNGGNNLPISSAVLRSSDPVGHGFSRIFKR